MANWNSFVDDDAKQNENSTDSGSPGPMDGSSKRHPTKMRHNSDDEQGKLFVGGLSWETTQDNLKDFFMKFGEVVDCVVMTNQETGRSRGFGFITFSDPSNVDHVLSSGPHILDGRTVDPKPCNPRNSQNRAMRNSYPKVFLGGLPSTVTETSLKQFFATYGKVTEVVIMYDQEKKKSRGFGFLSFETEECVDRCVAEHYVNINGKQVEVKKAEPRGEFRMGGGRGRGRGMGDGQPNQQGDGSWNMGAPGAAQGMAAGYAGWGTAQQQQQQYPPGWGPPGWPGQTPATGAANQQMATAQPGQMENWYAQQGQWGYGQGYGNWGWGQGYGQGMQAPSAGAPPPPPSTQPPPPPPPQNDNQGAAAQAPGQNKGAAYPQQYPQMGAMPPQGQYGAMPTGYGQNAPAMGMYNQAPSGYGGQGYPNATGNSRENTYASGGAAPPPPQSGSHNQGAGGGGGPQRPNYGQQQQQPGYHPYRRN